MPLVHRIIREQHIENFINERLYFARCDSFVDLLEFRFAHCRDSYELGVTAFQNCIRKSFLDDRVNARISATSISCWSEHAAEKCFMWEVYGRNEPAICLSADRDRLVEHVERSINAPGAAGSVTYQFMTSLVRPPFLRTFNGLSEDQHEEYDLFFHKHSFYEYEDEFRIILFQNGPIAIPFPPNLIQSITLSKVPIPAEILTPLRNKFGAIIQESRLR